MEIIAVVLTLLSVVLTVRSHILCWPIGILSSIAYMYVFNDSHIWFQFFLQIVFIGQSIHGWYYWRRNEEIKFNNSSLIYTAIDLTIVLIITVLASGILKDKTNNPQLTLDILTSLLSLLAMWYMATRNIMTWLIWVVADIFFIFMFMDQKMYWSVALYLVLTGLSIKGLIQWGRNMIMD